MKLPEKKQRWVYHAEALPQAAGEGVTRRVLAYTDGLMCVENTFEKGAVGALHHHPHTQAAVEEAASEEAASEDAASLETSDAASEEEASLAASEEAEVSD